MRGKGRLTGMTDISADSSRGDSDPSTLVQADLYEQWNTGNQMIIVMLAKNNSAHIYALT